MKCEKKSIILYRWFDDDSSLRNTFKNNALYPKRWKKFLEDENRFVIGNSFGLDEKRWKNSDSVVMIKVDVSYLPNKMYEMNGERSYWLTLSMLKPSITDPTIYKNYPKEKIDEVFVEGKIDDLNKYVLEIVVLKKIDEVEKWIFKYCVKSN